MIEQTSIEKEFGEINRSLSELSRRIDELSSRILKLQEKERAFFKALRELREITGEERAK